MQRLPLAKRFHELYPGIGLFAFERFSFTDYDVVISVCAKEAKGIITGPHTLHICYCLTPTRYLWSHYADYFKPGIMRRLSLPFVSLLRCWDTIAAQRPDHYLAISNTVAQRIAKFYRREAQVIYPPVELDKFKIKEDPKPGDYFLIVSRLVGYKHLEVAIEACSQLKLPLKIIGSGLERANLEKKAGPTVEFLGNLTEVEVIEYYQNCRALLFPQEEDFGITAVEALASGKPVICYRGGGALEIITPGVTGEFFWPQTSTALKLVLQKFAPTQYNSGLCRKAAERFSSRHFAKQFLGFIKKTIGGSQN